VEGGPPSAGPDGPQGAFDAETLQRLFASFAPFPQIALAVSGGADSTALMLLVRRWLDLAPAPLPQITVLTIDHKLRAASATEAQQVRQQATALGFAQQTLDWTEAKPKTGLQDAARQARYALLAGYCRAHGIPALATAHTQDDQAETVIMRLARGSGVDGLSAMAPQATLGGVALLRPLLGVSRDRLRGLLANSGTGWSEDPSNEDAHYERVRIRKALGKEDSLDLPPDKLALTAARLRRARDALDAAAAGALQASLTLEEAGWASMPLDALTDTAEEIAIRMLARITLALGGGDMPVPLTKVEAACERLRRSPKSLTLGGCQIALRAGRLRIAREYGRMPHGDTPYLPGMLWDRRFIIDAVSAAGAPLTVRPLGPDGIEALKDAEGTFAPVPRVAALALPSLWRNARLVHAPFTHFPQGAPRDWVAQVTTRFANRPALFDPGPNLRF
jgi:tRNA(Ile)-lysidine synthase